MPKYVVDTNLYIEAITTDGGMTALAAFQRRLAPFLYQHSTVAQEILAGAQNEGDFERYYEDWIAPFERLGRIYTPSHSSWVDAARIMTRLIESRSKSAGGFTRSFLNDCLIATSTRENGFILVTRNTKDFALINSADAGVNFAPPWPGS